MRQHSDQNSTRPQIAIETSSRRRFAVALTALLLSIAPWDEAAACECTTSKRFLEVAPHTALVIVGRVERQQPVPPKQVPLYIDVRIERVLSGVYKGQTIRIHGDDGALCRPYVTIFPVGTRWVWALSRDGLGRLYVISICGEHWLKVEGRYAVSTREKKTRYPLDELPRRLQTPNQLPKR